MKYGLRVLHDGIYQIEISAERYTELVKARKLVLGCLYLEEKFGIVLENFCEFEQEVLGVSLRHQVFGSAAYEPDVMTDAVFSVNRRFCNILTAIRSYDDQARKDLPQFADCSSGLIANEFSKVRDASPDYRLICQLRNFAQHEGLPIGNLTVGGTWIENRISGRDSHQIRTSVSFDALALVKAFKKSKYPAVGIETLDAVGVLRGSIEGLARVHEALRSLLHRQVAEAFVLMDDEFQKLSEELRQTPWLCFTEFTETGVAHAEHFLRVDILERTRRLWMRQVPNLRFKGFCVSSEAGT